MEAALGGEFQVHTILVVDHFFDGEIFAYEVLALPPELFSQRRIGDELQEPPGGGGNVAGVDEEAGFIFAADFVRAVKVVGDDGFSGGKGLGQGAGQGFAAGEMGDAVHDADISRHVAGRHEAGEDHLAVQAEGPDLALKFAA